MADFLDRFRLDGRVAIVTGTSSGLGIAFAGALAEAGATVVLAARRLDRVEELAGSMTAAGHTALAVRADVADENDCERLVATAVERFGRLDVLVNNAGIGAVVAAHRQTPAEFRRILDVNVAGTHWMSLAACAVMGRGSSIINVSSVLALTSGGIPQAAYAASKAGILGLTRDLAREWTGRRGIRVNAILPGFFVTEMTEKNADYSAVLGRIAAGRLGDPDDLAGAVVYLASDASTYITGQNLVVDGGFAIS